jgi:hypothetical protein
VEEHQRSLSQLPPSATEYLAMQTAAFAALLRASHKSGLVQPGSWPAVMFVPQVSPTSRVFRQTPVSASASASASLPTKQNSAVLASQLPLPLVDAPLQTSPTVAICTQPEPAQNWSALHGTPAKGTCTTV